MQLKRINVVFCLMLALIFACPGPAQPGDGALDPSFNPGLGVSKIPIVRGKADWTTLIDNVTTANGNSLIYGYFTSLDGNAINSIAKLTDFSGTVDTNFNIPVNGEVRGAILQDSTSPTSNIIIWGSFSLSSGSYTCYNLAKLKWNGSAYAVDETFPVVFNPGGLVSTIAVFEGAIGTNPVLVGGYNLQPVGGAANTAYHLIRLTKGFAFDGDYTRHLSLPGGYVTAININTSNQPRILGTLPQSGGGYHWLEILDNTNYTTLLKSLGDQATIGTNYGPIDGPIFALAQPGLSSGPWIIVGAFKNVFGQALNRVAQLNNALSDRSDNNSFNTNIASGGGADHSVQQIYIPSGGGQPVLSGTLTNFNGADCGHLVRLNYAEDTGGTVDIGFNTSGDGADDRIFRLYRPAGLSELHILGSFQKYNLSTKHCIASLDLNGTPTGGYGSVNPVSTTPGTVYAVEATWTNNGAYIVIGGDFTGVNGKFHQNLAWLNLDGSPAAIQPNPAFEGPVMSIRGLEGTPSGQPLLIAGNFGQAMAYGCTGLARLNPDGSFDPTFRPIVTQSNGTVAELRGAESDDNLPGKYNIMGIFAKIADSSHALQPRNAFARLNNDGSLDSDFNAQISIPNNSNICVNTGGSMGGGNYGMAGYYLESGANDRGFACVLDQVGIQQSYMLLDGEVKCATGLSDGRILFGGKFTQVTYPVTASRGHILAITHSFTLDSSFAGDGANGPIHALRAQGDDFTGKVLIGGNFTAYNGISRNNVARLNRDGSLDSIFNPGIGTNNKVHAIAWTQWGNNGPTIGKAVLGGAFTTYDGVSRPGIAQVFASMGANPAIYFLLLLGN